MNAFRINSRKLNIRTEGRKEKGNQPRNPLITSKVNHLKIKVKERKGRNHPVSCAPIPKRMLTV